MSGIQQILEELQTNSFSEFEMELNEEEAKHTWDILTHFKSNPYRFSGNKEMISACSNSFAGDSKRNQFQMNKT